MVNSSTFHSYPVNISQVFIVSFCVLCTQSIDPTSTNFTVMLDDFTYSWTRLLSLVLPATDIKGYLKIGPISLSYGIALLESYALYVFGITL